MYHPVISIGNLLYLSNRLPDMPQDQFSFLSCSFSSSVMAFTGFLCITLNMISAMKQTGR